MWYSSKQKVKPYYGKTLPIKIIDHVISDSFDFACVLCANSLFLSWTKGFVCRCSRECYPFPTSLQRFACLNKTIVDLFEVYFADCSFHSEKWYIQIFDTHTDLGLSFDAICAAS